MRKTYRRVLATLLLGAVVVFVVARAQAADEQKVANRIASYVEDRLIVSGSTVYRAASVTAAIDVAGQLNVYIDADPLFPLESRNGERRAQGHHEYAIPAGASCGETHAFRNVDGTDFAVREGTLFIGLRDALRMVMDDVPAFASRPTLIEVDALDLRRMRDCARTAAKLVTRP